MTDTHLRLNIRASGHIELLTLSGAWVGQGVGSFRTTCDALLWASRNGYEVTT